MMEGEVAQSASGDKGQKPKITGEADVFAKSLERGMASETVHSSDSDLIAALADVRRAIERATAIGQERKIAINRKHITGRDCGLDPSLIDAFSQTRSSWTSLGALADDMKSRFHGTPIYKLPPEVMLTVFSYVATETLLNCRSTCQEWKAILTSRAASNEVWAKKPAEIHGAIEEFDAKWEEIKEIFYIPTSLSLKLQHYSDESLYDPLRNLRVVKEFPSRWLRKFAYDGPASTPVWDCVKQCLVLKTLHWKTLDHPHPDTNYKLRDNSPLASCRLDECVFEFRRWIEVDLPFVQMLSQSRRLHMIGGLDQVTVVAIFRAAAEFLEEITISGLKGGGCRSWLVSGSGEIEISCTMPVLRKISIYGMLDFNLSITAPEATSVRFVHDTFIDWALIDSCRSKLESLHIETEGSRTVGRLGQELFDMPQLEDLHLDYTRSNASTHYSRTSREPVVRYDDYSTAAFWQTLDSDDMTIARSILPKLKSLKIIHDPMLDEDRLVKYIARRAFLGQPALEVMDVSLANQFSDRTSRLDAIQAETAGFKYKRFEDWKESYTAKWSRTTEMMYRDTICWEGLDQCRSILKELKISGLSANCYDKCHLAGIEEELFDMPQLQVLDLRFTDHSYRRAKKSATALWSSISTGKIHKKGVSLQDILPRLKTLHIYFDVSLDEEIIVKFITLRKSLNLTTIETMHINLAQSCSKETSGLERLKMTMPGFTFMRY